MRFGFVGPSYTVSSTAIADEEAINLYAQTVESQGAIVPTSAYGGKNAASLKGYFRTPGLVVFVTFPESPVRELLVTPNGRLFAIAGSQLIEVFANGGTLLWANVSNDGSRASMACNGPQILICATGHAYCFNLGTGVLTEVTSLLQGIPIKCEYSDSYFIVCFQNSNEFQLSQILDGTTWPGQLVNEVSVFPDNVISIAVNHRELWVFGQNHTQPYQDTGSADVFDVIPGTLIESGIAGPFCVDRLDNSLFWVSNDARGARMCWRSNGYTPQRISTYAVEADLNSYPDVSGLSSYSYQDRGHLFWVIYIPQSNWSWCYDVVEGLWHKRTSWNVIAANQFGPHLSWNHVYAFNRHLVGDWNSGSLYTLTANSFTDAGNAMRWLRRTPAVMSEMARQYHAELTVDFEMGNLNQIAPSDLPAFAPSLYGPSIGTAAVDTATGGISWQDVPNVLVPGQAGLAPVYANAPLTGSVYEITSVEAIETNFGGTLAYNVYFVLVTFSTVVPPVGTEFTFANLGSYVTLDGLTMPSQAGGGSYVPTPTAYQVLLSFGKTSVPLQSNTADTGQATTPAITQSSDALDVTVFDFAIPAATTPAGITASILAYATALGVSLTVQLLKAGVPVSAGLSLPLSTNPTIYYFGMPAWLWGAPWANTDINAGGFGLRITATASSSVSASVNVAQAQLQVYSPPTVPSFNYIGPAPVLLDGAGNPRPPQAMMRFSDTRGKTWSNEHIANLGVQGDYTARAIWRRLGQSRYRVYEVSGSDPVPIAIVDAYLRLDQ